MECPSCNLLNPKDAKFCNYCATSLAQETQTADNSETRFCTECGTELELVKPEIRGELAQRLYATQSLKHLKCPDCGLKYGSTTPEGAEVIPLVSEESTHQEFRGEIANKIITQKSRTLRKPFTNQIIFRIRERFSGGIAILMLLFWLSWGVATLVIDLMIVSEALGWGFFGVALAILFFPITFISAPFYALIAWGNWLPLLLTLGGILIGVAMSVILQIIMPKD